MATARELGFGGGPALDLLHGAEGTVPTWRASGSGGEPQDLRAGSSEIYRELCRDAGTAVGRQPERRHRPGRRRCRRRQLALGYGALANGGTKVYRPCRRAGRCSDLASGRVVRRVAPRVAGVAEVPGGARVRRRPGLASVPSGDGGVRLRRVPAGPVPGGRARPARPTCRPRRRSPGLRRTPRWGPAVRGRGHGRAGRPRRRVGRPGGPGHLPEAVRLLVTLGKALWRLGAADAGVVEATRTGCRVLG